MTFQEVKAAFISIYGSQGNNLFTDQELNFDEAFKKAWESVDSFESDSVEDAAIEMASFSYLSFS